MSPFGRSPFPKRVTSFMDGPLKKRSDAIYMTYNLAKESLSPQTKMVINNLY